MFVRFLAIACAAFAFALPADARPPVDAFQPTPDIHDMTISPDGKRIAWVQTSAEGDGVAERDLDTGATRAVIRADGRKITSLRYLTDKHLHAIAYRVRYDATDKDIYNLGTAHIIDLARGVTYRFDSYGRILTVSEDDRIVYMLGRGEVLGIDLATGNLASTGMSRNWEDDFIVSRAGKLVAAQDINRETGNNRIFAAAGLDRTTIFQEEPKAAEVHLLGAMPGEAAVVVLDMREGHRVVRPLGLADGKLGDPLFLDAGGEVVAAVRDRTGALVGVSIADIYPRYAFFDADLTADARSVRASFPGQGVTIVGWSDDRNRMLVNVQGGIEPGRYAIFDRAARKLITLMPTRPSISKEDMGEVVSIEYPARDGRKIGAVITWPAGVAADQRRKLPLVVLPHDAPHDTFSGVTFDWMAQFLANEGYAVFQPNYRGSAGSADLRRAGYDEFGRKMQHDVTDGVYALVQMGWVDDDRICIVGEGWGGYMALTGSAITPGRYRCVASISGITDLPDFLKKQSEGDQRYNDFLGRWKNMLGDPERNRENLQRYSPVNLARQFTAPVLLIHADNDFFSPDRQSRKMQQALEAQGKPVTYILLERENADLLRPESRRRVLTELAGFLAANLKPRPPEQRPALPILN